MVPSVFGAAERGATGVSKESAPRGGQHTAMAVLANMVGIKALRFAEAPLL